MIFTQALRDRWRRPAAVSLAVTTLVVTTLAGAVAAWDGAPAASAMPTPATIRIELREPTALAAFAIGSDEIEGHRRGIPARIEVALSAGGSQFDKPIELDHAERPHHQWHLLPGAPVRALRLTIARTYDRKPAAIDDTVYEFDLDDERRIIGFRPTLASSSATAAAADARYASVNPPDRPPRSSSPSQPAKSPPRRSDCKLPASPNCTVDLYAVASGDSGTPESPSHEAADQISDEDRGRALKQMKALGYIE